MISKKYWNFRPKKFGGKSRRNNESEAWFAPGRSECILGLSSQKSSNWKFKTLPIFAGGEKGSRRRLTWGLTPAITCNSYSVLLLFQMLWLFPPSGDRFPPPSPPPLAEIIFLIWFLGVSRFAQGIDSDTWSLITYWLFIIIIWHAKLLASATDQRDARDTYIKKKNVIRRKLQIFSTE